MKKNHKRVLINKSQLKSKSVCFNVLNIYSYYKLLRKIIFFYYMKININKKWRYLFLEINKVVEDLVKPNKICKFVLVYCASS